jgi:serine/threonine protein kinase
MAPSRPSPASDLYSLGIVALESFTGRPVNRSASGVIDVRAIAPGLTPILAAILSRLVARTPEERFISASALMDSLAPLVGAM